MNLQQINYAFTSTIDLAAGFLPPCALACGGGYIYGYLFNTDKALTATAFTISILAHYALQKMIQVATGGVKKNAKGFYTFQFLGVGALGVVQILAYRKLNLIGMIGTAVLSACLLLGSLTYLNKLNSL